MAHWGFVFDQRKCIGCNACQMACKDHHDLEAGLFFRRAMTVSGKENGGVFAHYSGACNHCADPACVRHCPTGAYYVREDGTVGHHPERCIGCGTCTWACPYGAPHISARRGLSMKCTSCPEVRAEGREPLCVEACLTHCLSFTDLDAIPEEEKRGMTNCLPFLPSPELTQPSLLIRRKDCPPVVQGDASSVILSGACNAGEVEGSFVVAAPQDDKKGTAPQDDKKKTASQDGKTDSARNGTPRIVILGAGIAGISACKRILREAPGAEITLLSDERDLPYVRPLLSKLALTTFRRDSLSLHSEEWYRDNRIRLLTSAPVDRILPEQKQVLLMDGTLLPYDKCIYALGAHCHVPPIPGTDLPGTACVRTIDDLQKIRRLLATARQAVVIGGGVIGLEFAWEIKKSGCEVTVLEALPHLMERVLDPQSAAVLEERCTSCGISVHTGVNVERIIGTDRAEAVVLSDGRSFAADLVLLSCGIRANTEVAKRSGLACGRGVLTDDHLMTGVPGIYAAGDCIQVDESELHHAEGLCRTEDLNPGLWTYAKETGSIAGFNAVHAEDEALVFEPKNDPLLLSALGTSLYVAGDVREEAYDRVECREWRDEEPAPPFFVNPHDGSDLHYEKRFYRGGRLCGAVLIGSLEKLPEIRQELSS